MGMNGCSMMDNPFVTDGPLYDGANSMGEAAIWYKGWHEAQEALGRIPKKPVPPAPDGFDYLEAQRG